MRGTRWLDSDAKRSSRDPYMKTYPVKSGTRKPLVGRDTPGPCAPSAGRRESRGPASGGQPSFPDVIWCIEPTNSAPRTGGRRFPKGLRGRGSAPGKGSALVVFTWSWKKHLRHPYPRERRARQNRRGENNSLIIKRCLASWLAWETPRPIALTLSPCVAYRPAASGKEMLCRSPC